MKKGVLLLVIIAFTGAFNAQSQTSDIKSNSVIELPVGYPVSVNTGNLEIDSATYAYAKLIWISENMQAYNDYVKAISTSTNKNQKVNLGELEENKKIIARIELSKKNSVPEKQKITRSDFNNLPLEKQKLYLAAPDKFEIID